MTLKEQNIQDIAELYTILAQVQTNSKLSTYMVMRISEFIKLELDIAESCAVKKTATVQLSDCEVKELLMEWAQASC
jgi:hypothetical protein